MSLRAGALLALLLFPAPLAAEEDEDSAQWGLIPAGGLVLLFDSVGPMSYAAMTGRDIPRDAVRVGEVRGRTCQHGFSIPLGSPLDRSTQSVSAAGGRSGFRRTLDALRKEHPGLRGIYDLKVDDRILSVLGFYRRYCTEITASGFR